MKRIQVVLDESVVVSAWDDLRRKYIRTLDPSKTYIIHEGKCYEVKQSEKFGDLFLITGNLSEIPQ